MTLIAFDMCLCMKACEYIHTYVQVITHIGTYCNIRMYRTYVHKYILYLYPGEGANYRWIKGKSVLTFVM